MDTLSLAYYIVMAAINFLSILLNLLLLIMFLVYRRELLISPHNSILMAMLLACLLIGITGTVNWVLVALEVDKDVYKIIGMIPMFSCFLASIATLCILTLDQLIAVKHPLRYAAIVTSRRTNIAIATAFALALIFASIQIAILKIKGSNVELEVRGVVMTVIFLAGMLLLIIANYRLYQAIQYQRKRLLPLSCSNARASQEVTVGEAYTIQSRQSSMQDSPKRVRKFKSGRMCIWLVVIYILHWLPLVVYRVTWTAGRETAIPLFLRISMILATCYQIIMPCIYLLKRGDFRQKLNQLICKCTQS